jgi:hypothetical protein
MKHTRVALAGMVLSFLAAFTSAVSGASVVQRESKPVGSNERQQSAGQNHDASSSGWYWVYEGVAQAQTFRASGNEVDKLQFRVAQLNQQAPTGDLEVEIRDLTLKEIYLRGTIPAAEATRDFRGVSVPVEHAVPLEKGSTYVLLLHSRNTAQNCPWVVNAIYRDLYSEGRHLGYCDDLFFLVAYRNGDTLRVGPSSNEHFVRPLNSGFAGGPSMRQPLTLVSPKVVPAAAREDPLGPIPSARLVDSGAAAAARTSADR